MIQNVLWTILRWFPFGAAIYLLLVFLVRRLWLDLPFFMCYLAAALSTGIVRYISLLLGQKPYFYAYWISDLVVSVTVFFSIYEVFLRRLFVGFQKTTAYRRIFPAVGFAVLALTIVSALEAANRGAAFQMASRAFDFMRTAVLIFFIGLMALMGRQWTRHDLGVALGFGVQAAAALTAAAVRTRSHYMPTFLDSVEIFAYDLSCLIWIIAFSQPERRNHPSIPVEGDGELIYQARKWEQMLKKWLAPGKRVF